MNGETRGQSLKGSRNSRLADVVRQNQIDNAVPPPSAMRIAKRQEEQARPLRKKR